MAIFDDLVITMICLVAFIVTGMVVVEFENWSTGKLYREMQETGAVVIRVKYWGMNALIPTIARLIFFSLKYGEGKQAIHYKHGLGFESVSLKGIHRELMVYYYFKPGTSPQEVIEIINHKAKNLMRISVKAEHIPTD